MAIIAEKSEKKKNAMTLKVGNLIPNQSAVIKISMVELIGISGNAYAYVMPTSFFPDYSKHSASSGSEKEINYKFQYFFSIVSDQRLVYLSCPTGSTHEFNPDKT
jgi:hypothetical protein